MINPSSKCSPVVQSGTRVGVTWQSVHYTANPLSVIARDIQTAIKTATGKKLLTTPSSVKSMNWCISQQLLWTGRHFKIVFPPNHQQSNVAQGLETGLLALPSMKMLRGNLQKRDASALLYLWCRCGNTMRKQFIKVYIYNLLRKAHPKYSHVSTWGQRASRNHGRGGRKGAERFTGR